MGFGYLFLGYLTSFVLYVTANALNGILGGAVLLLGYMSMTAGVWQLRSFCPSFRWGLIPLTGLILTAVWKTLFETAAVLHWNWDTAVEAATPYVEWGSVLLLFFFHAFLLFSIRELANEVELPKTANASLRNFVFVSVYVFLYIFVRLPIAERIAKYLNLSLSLCLVVYVVLNLVLLLSCMKNICPEGEEEIGVKRYRWNFLNRIGDRFAKTQEDAVNKNKNEIENFLKKRKEKKESKNKK